MPNVKDVYYFSHDSNARNDEKILMLRAEHGWEGYGLYWALVEMMFEASDTALYHSKVKGLALSYNTDITLLESVINTAIEEGLFKSDNERFWSESLLRRKAAFHELREKKSLAGKKGMASRWGTDNTVITENNKGKEKKVKESKGKESKEEYSVNGVASVQNIIDLFHDKCPSLPRLKTLTDKRKKQIKSRISKYPDILIYEELFQKTEKSDFLTGRNGKFTACNIDWLMNENNMVKVLEGNYDNKKKDQTPVAWDNIKSWREEKEGRL